MLLLIGLGNPGDKYQRHRHNVGFMAIDAINDAHGFSTARRKFNAEISDGFLDGASGRVKTLLIKPLTYMNESGQSVGEAMRFYKLAPENVVVFHDELDLAPGKLRAKIGGGNAGHNGLRSISAHIGNEYRRIRIGIGHPGAKSKVSSHVLGDFAKVDEAWLPNLLAAIAKASPKLGTDDQRFANDVAMLSQPLSEKPNEKPKTKISDTAPLKTKQSDVQKNIFADKLKNLFGGKEEN